MVKSMKEQAVEKKGALKKPVKVFPLAKGKAKSQSKAGGKKTVTTAESLAKGLAKGKAMKCVLEKGALDALPKVSLAQRVQMLAESTENPEEAALTLRSGMSKLDKSVMWSQYQTHLKTNPALAKEYGDLSNKEKGEAQALWFVKKSSPKFMHFQMTVSGGDSVTRADNWESEKQMLDRFGRDELDRHLYSGRVLWRVDPYTADVYQYKDQGDYKRTVTVNRNKKLTQQQEYIPNQDQDDWFSSIFDADLAGMLSDSTIFSSSSLGKGKGGGKALDLGKGKGKGLGKGKGKEPPEPEDHPMTEGELLEAAQRKCRKMRDLCAKTASDLELRVKDAKKTKFWSKAAQRDADELQVSLQKQCGELKMVLLKKSDQYETMKQVCVEAAGKVKEALVQMKEFKQLVHKTSSKASTKK
jgi:hypothetical protein